jgi:hypothetical protein
MWYCTVVDNQYLVHRYMVPEVHTYTHDPQQLPIPLLIPI